MGKMSRQNDLEKTGNALQQVGCALGCWIPLLIIVLLFLWAVIRS